MAIQLIYEFDEASNSYLINGYLSSDENDDLIIPEKHNGDEGELPVSGIKGMEATDSSVLKGLSCKKVVISSALSFGKNAFYGTNISEGVYVTNIQTWMAINFNGANSNPLYRNGTLYINNEKIQLLTIPSNITILKNSCFAGLNVDMVIIPDSVQKIEHSAFYGAKIKSIQVGTGVKEIRDSVFSNCINLTEITLPNTITSFGNYIFYNCSNLIDIYYCGSKEVWNSYVDKFSDKGTDYQNEIFEKVRVHNSIMDFDFTGFTYDGYHSLLDLNIIRTSEGDRYNTNLSPQMKDMVTEVPNGDGQYYFGTNYPSQPFQINFAFDSLTDKQLRKLKQVFAGDRISDLIFDEEPYKVYSAKVTSVPTLKYIPFNEQNGQRVYKGEGTVQFTAFWPYAHTPDTTTKISKKFRESGTFEKNGLLVSQYDEWLYPTKGQWAPSSGIINTGAVRIGENYGDVPAPFVLKYSTITEDLKFTVGSNHIIVRAKEYEVDNPDKPGPTFTNFKWDSKTGMVSAKINGAANEVPISYEGDSCGEIPVGGVNTIKIEKWITNQWVDTGNKPTLEYNYWYY